MNKVHEFTWQSGLQARWMRLHDGSVRYIQNGKVAFTMTQDGWRTLVDAMAITPLRTDPLPIIGEVIGFRCWQYRHPYLWSLRQNYMWTPGDTHNGHVGAGAGGIYAFKDLSRAVTEASSHEWKVMSIPMVVGTVKLWGDAVECENGWRAEYAKIVALDRVIRHPKFWLWRNNSSAVLARLRHRYGVEHQRRLTSTTS